MSLVLLLLIGSEAPCLGIGGEPLFICGVGYAMPKHETHPIAIELRKALSDVGLEAEGRIGVKVEHYDQHTEWIRVMITIRGTEYDLHSPAESWPAAEHWARSLLYVCSRPRESFVLDTSSEMSAGQFVDQCNAVYKHNHVQHTLRVRAEQAEG